MITHDAYPHMIGRNKLPWGEDVWKRLDTAVHEEMTRARVAAKFMPTVHVPAMTLTVPSDAVVLPGSPSAAAVPGAVAVDEGATTRINEYWVEFVMTPAQIEQEAAAARGQGKGASASTGITLATRAANVLALAEDLVIFQGANALQSPLFSGVLPSATEGGGGGSSLGLGGSNFTLSTTASTTIGAILINTRGAPTDLGLANIVLTGSPQGQPALPSPLQVIAVPPASGAFSETGGIYQDGAVGSVALAYSVLRASGQYGPYALVMNTIPYANMYLPLENTLSVPADLIKDLVNGSFYATGALPPWEFIAFSGGPLTGEGTSGGLPPPPPGSSSGVTVLFTGVLVSLGGNTMDLVRGSLHPEHDAVISFESKDPNGDCHFRVVQRFALRLKDITAVALFEFLSPRSS
jgi:uncharacterized linocin/CFP29 family protein